MLIHLRSRQVTIAAFPTNVLRVRASHPPDLIYINSLPDTRDSSYHPFTATLCTRTARAVPLTTADRSQIFTALHIYGLFLSLRLYLAHPPHTCRVNWAPCSVRSLERSKIIIHRKQKLPPPKRLYFKKFVPAPFVRLPPIAPLRCGLPSHRVPLPACSMQLELGRARSSALRHVYMCGPRVTRVSIA